MKKWKLVLALISVLSVFLTYCRDTSPQESTHSWKHCDHPHQIVNITDHALDTDPLNDEVIFMFKKRPRWKQVERINTEFGIRLQPNSPNSRIYMATVPEGVVPQIHAHAAHLFESVKVAEDFTLQSYGMKPNDPLYQFQWNFEQVGAEKAWTRSTGRGVVVAVIDTGIALDTDLKHKIKPVKDLEQTKRVKGYDFVLKSDFAMDGNGHGTHVAGTIAQSTGNEYGTAGLAYNATLMPVRVLDTNGSGSSANVADGIIFAADNGAHVINLSLGSSQSSPIIKGAVEHAKSRGVVIVAAAGNDGSRSPGYPAAYPEVISVAATQYDKHTAFYSQWGTTIDIAAPGGNVREDQNGDGRPDGIMQETVEQGKPDQHHFGIFMGTSMASPHVAAVAALVMERGITNPSRVEAILKETTDVSMRQEEPDEKSFTPVDGKPDKYEAKEFELRYGAGIVQADLAVKMSIWSPSLYRLIASLILSLLVLKLVTRKEFLESDVKLVGIFLGTSIFFASGLFVLALYNPLSHVGVVAVVSNFLSTPMARWDWLLFGSNQTPVFASVLIPAIAIVFLHGHNTLRYVAAGIAVGFGAYCIVEMIQMNSTVMFLASWSVVWYAMMGIGNVAMAYMTLKE